MNIPFDSSKADHVKALSDFVALIARATFCWALAIGVGDAIRSSSLEPEKVVVLLLVALVFGFLGVAIMASIFSLCQIYTSYVFEITGKPIWLVLIGFLLSSLIYGSIWAGASIIILVTKTNLGSISTS